MCFKREKDKWMLSRRNTTDFLTFLNLFKLIKVLHMCPHPLIAPPPPAPAHALTFFIVFINVSQGSRFQEFLALPILLLISTEIQRKSLDLRKIPRETIIGFDE